MGKRPGRELSAEEALIWRRVARSARPLPGRVVPEADSEAAARANPAPAARSRQSVLSTAPPRPAQKSAPAKPGPPPEISGERRVRRGKLEVGAKIDLHGMTQIQARAALGRFLARARMDGVRTALVITGKGRGGEGVIRRAVPGWLAEESALVSGYAPAHARHGGAGALYVRLRRQGQ